MVHKKMQVYEIIEPSKCNLCSHQRFLINYANRFYLVAASTHYYAVQRLYAHIGKNPAPSTPPPSLPGKKYPDPGSKHLLVRKPYHRVHRRLNYGSVVAISKFRALELIKSGNAVAIESRSDSYGM